MAKGVWQSIGLKEFDPFLKLPPEERESSEGEKLFDAGAKRLAISTGKYATVQERRIRNRLLRVPGRELPPMYQLDVSDEAACTASTNAAVTLVENFLTGAAPAAEISHLRLMADSADNLDSQQRIDWHSAKCIKCLHCDIILGSEFQWEKHVAGRNHRYRRGLAKRDGLNWDDLNPDGRSDFSDSEID